jgi:hypothetical protein
MANTEENKVLLRKLRLEAVPYHVDGFTVCEGRFVGHDGFIVPKDFTEFYERFPRYVFDWVRRRLGGRVWASEVEDWTQELLMHLQSLPLNSKYRQNGKTDVIQTFAPERMHGANEARFRSFINRCLVNKFNTLYVSRRNKPLFNFRNLLLTDNADEPRAISDEYCHEQSPQLRKAGWQSRERYNHEVRLKEFSRFADACCPGLASVMEAFRMTGTWQEAARTLRIGTDECTSIRYRLRELGRVFLSGDVRTRFPD